MGFSPSSQPERVLPGENCSHSGRNFIGTKLTGRARTKSEIRGRKSAQPEIRALANAEPIPLPYSFANDPEPGARSAASRRWLCKPKSPNSPEPRITRMEIATGLRKTPASQRVHPPGARAWLRKPFRSVSIREIRGLNRRFEDPDWKNRDPRETTRTTHGAGSRIPHSLAIPTQSGGLHGRDQLFS